MSDNNSSIGKVQLDLETNYAPFQRQLNSIAGKSTNMVKSAFVSLGKVAAGAFAVTKLIQFGKSSIELASDLQEVQNVVDVVFGESSNQINNFAKNAISAYGLSELSAKKYASTMGAMLKSMGLSQSSVVDMSQSITALAGDMASFYNLSGDEAFNKIRSGISGETEPLKQLGINMSVANMEAFALSQGISKSYQKMTQSEQALLRYNYLLSTTADAQGDFARTSSSWANQTRILTEQFNSLKGTLGAAFISLLTPVVKMLNAIISRLQILANYFKAFVEALTGAKSETSSTSSGLNAIADSATEAGDATEAAAKKASNALAGFDKLNVLSSSSDSSNSSGGAGGSGALDLPELTGLNSTLPEPDTSGVERAVNKVKGFFGSLKTYISTSFAPSIKSWGNAFTNLKEPVKSALSSISTSAQNLWNGTLKPLGGYIVGDFVPSIVNSFSNTFAPIFTDVMSFALDQFAKDFEFACRQVSNFVNDIFRPALDTVKTITIDVNNIIKTEWDRSGQHLLNMFGKVRDSLKQIWDTVYETVLKPIWQTLITAINDLWDKHLKKLWGNIASFFSKLAEAVMTIWNNALAPLMNWIVKTFGPVISDAVSGIIKLVKNILGIMSDVCSGIFKALGGLLDFITGVFSGNWKKAWTGIKDFFKGVWDAIWAIVKGIINLIIGGINTLWSGLYKVIKALVDGIGGIAGAIGDLLGKDWRFSMPKKPPTIPYLAKGGIINQPTLAMVGESGKEAVVPLENTSFAESIANAILRVISPLLKNNSSNNHNGDGNYTFVLKIGEYEFGRISVGAINKYHNVIGKVELEV